MIDVRANLGAHRQQHPCEDCGTLKRHERRCPKFKTASNAVKRGKRRELYVERRYGPTKVGQFNDAIDNIGSSFKWQSKTTTAEPPLWAHNLAAVGIAAVKPRKWFTDPMEHMAGLHDDLAPLLIKSWTHQGRPAVDVIVVAAFDWCCLHGVPEGTADAEYLVLTGDAFLDIHGPDRRETA